MKSIPFSRQYKKAILNKTKNTTIRTSEEMGKYKVGHTYIAKSYAGNAWPVKIKIISVIKIKILDLSNYRIPIRTQKSIVDNNKLKLNSFVELIKFKVI